MEHNNLATALAAAQSEMGHAALDSENPYFKSKYSSLTAVIDAVKPLAKHGIAYIQHSRPVNNGVGIETVFYGYSEAIGTGIVAVPVAKPDAHSIGAAITYAKRYSLAMACGISADEDDDGNAVSAKPKKRGQSVVDTVIEQQGLTGDQKKMRQHAAAIEAITDDSELLEAYIELKDGDADYATMLWKFIAAPVRKRMRALLAEHNEMQKAATA